MSLIFYEHSNKNNNNSKPKYLVIFLHGYGANGMNLIELAHEYEKVLGDARFIAPNAPSEWEGGFPDAYQWFSLMSWGSDRDVSKVADGVKEAQKKLSDFIDEELEKSGLKPENLILVGFSQGSMMAMYYALSSKNKIKGVVAHSGKLILPELIGEKTNSKPEICLIHGKSDMVVGFENFLEAEKLASENEIPFESHAIEGLDHSIDFSGLKAGMKFVEKITG